MQPAIFKVGAIILNSSGEILVVRKRVPGRTEFIIPGGRQEEGENDEQTLRRELDEELGVELTSMKFFGRFEEAAIFENTPLVMQVYEAEVKGTLLAQSEIKEYVWVDRDYSNKGFLLGTVLSKHVIPQLIQEGKM